MSGTIVLDLTVQQYATFNWSPIIYGPDGNPLNVTDYLIKMTLKKSKCVDDIVIYQALSTGTPPQITIPSQEGSTLGQVDVQFPASDCAAFSFHTVVYDLLAISNASPAIVTRAYEGSLYLDRGVTIYP